MLPDKVQAMLDRHAINFKKLEEKDLLAKKEGKLVGRYIREGYADGYAIYEIIKETKNSVRIRVVTDIGDDWRIPYWGEEATIDKWYAKQNVEGRDALRRIFSSN